MRCSTAVSVWPPPALQIAWPRQSRSGRSQTGLAGAWRSTLKLEVRAPGPPSLQKMAPVAVPCSGLQGTAGNHPHPWHVQAHRTNRHPKRKPAQPMRAEACWETRRSRPTPQNPPKSRRPRPLPCNVRDACPLPGGDRTRNKVAPSVEANIPTVAQSPDPPSSAPALQLAGAGNRQRTGSSDCRHGTARAAARVRIRFPWVKGTAEGIGQSGSLVCPGCFRRYPLCCRLVMQSYHLPERRARSIASGCSSSPPQRPQNGRRAGCGGWNPTVVEA